MGERDAFGREQGEDTLADVGWLPPEPTRTQPPPDWVKPQPAEPAPVVRSAPRPRRRRRRGFSRLIFFLALLVILAASAGSLFRLVDETVRDAIDTPVTRTPNDGGSLLAPTALRTAVDQLPAGRVTVLAIRQDGLDATITRNGQTTLVHVAADGDTTAVEAPVAVPGKSVRLDPAAPGRIVRTVTRRTGRAARSISQLVLTNGRWTLQFPDGVQFTANAKGTKVRRIT